MVLDKKDGSEFEGNSKGGQALVVFGLFGVVLMYGREFIDHVRKEKDDWLCASCDAALAERHSLVATAAQS